MDGVLHQFGKPVSGASAFLGHLLDEEIPFVVITNECRYTNSALQAKLEKILGVTVPTSQIYTSGNAVGAYFHSAVNEGFHGNVFVIGEDGLKESVERALSHAPGARVVTCETPAEEAGFCEYVAIGSVFTGGPNDTMVGAERASSYLKQGAKLVYSNPDWYEVTEAGEYKFGCPMPLVNLLKETTGISGYNLGKPNPFMLRQAHKRLSKVANLAPAAPGRSRGPLVDLGDVLFVGDSLNTDVRTAIENGIDAALVLSGTTTPEMLKLSALHPNYVFKSIKDLHGSLSEGDLRCGSRNHRRSVNGRSGATAAIAGATF